MFRQCKVFEGECQCQSRAVTDPSLRDLCDTHENKFVYLKDLYHKNHEEYEKLEADKKLYFTKYSDFQMLQALNEAEDKNNKYMLAMKPEWIFEWNFEKNTDLTYYGKKINIHDLYSKCGKMSWWTCFCGYCYQKTPNARMAAKCPCKKCANKKQLIREPERNSRRIIKAKEESEGKISDIAKGDAIEIYFEQLLKSTNTFKNVTRLGQLGGSSDIEIILQDDSIRQLQIKKLTKKKQYSYFASEMFKYVSNMLIAGANADFTRFFIGFSQEFHDARKEGAKSDKVNFPFFKGRDKSHDQFCYLKDYENEKHNEKAFLNKLIHDIPLSTNENHLNKDHQKERESQERFALFCKKLGLIYERNTTHASAIDGFVKIKTEHSERVFSLQLKYCSTTSDNSLVVYIIGASKSCGKKYQEPYHINDGIDFFVAEIGGLKDNLQRYHNNFIIIPKNIMAEQEIFRSDTCPGKQGFSIRPPDYNEHHWGNPFWNHIPDEWGTDI